MAKSKWIHLWWVYDSLSSAIYAITFDPIWPRQLAIWIGSCKTATFQTSRNSKRRATRLPSRYLVILVTLLMKNSIGRLMFYTQAGQNPFYCKLAAQCYISYDRDPSRSTICWDRRHHFLFPVCALSMRVFHAGLVFVHSSFPKELTDRWILGHSDCSISFGEEKFNVNNTNSPSLFTTWIMLFP